MRAPPRHFDRPGGSRRRRLLLTGASLSALSLGLVPGAPAQAGLGSPAFFAQVSARLGTATAGTTGVGAAGGATALAIPQVAQAIAARTQADLARAVNAVTLAAQQQAAAAVAAAAATSRVLDGVQAPGATIPAGALPGLVPCTTNPCGTANAPVDITTWQNANLPVAFAHADGTTDVTVTQTAPKAIATWQSFNLGKNTTLTFDQTAGTDQSGNNAWVILNRVSDPSLSPSQIYGAIKAKGTVYVINPNGVVFDGTSTVDVHALVASTLDIGQIGQTTAQRNAQFLQQGLNITSGLAQSQITGSNTAFSSTAGDASAVLAETSEAEVKIAAGARITTSVFPSDNPGSVMLLGPKVSNEGSIVSPAGQVILGAGRAFAFLANTTVNAATGVNYLGLVPVSQPNFLVPGTVSAQDSEFGRVWHGSIIARNSGLIETSRGNITLQGTDVVNSGVDGGSAVLAATTSITRNGSIVLDGAKSVTFGSGATAVILPENNGETIPIGQVSASTVPLPYIQVQAGEIGDSNALTGVSGLGAVTLASGAEIVAPGATVGVYGGLSVQLAAGATIDVAGLTTGALIDGAGNTVTALPMADNFITFKPLGPEFANSPLQRSGALRGQELTIDTRITGTNANGISWVGTPLANASGYVNTQVTDTINQVLTKGGTVTMATGAGIQPIAGHKLDSIVLQPGSVIDVSGGYVTYSGGFDTASNLLGADGKVYAISQADPSNTYVGLAGAYVDDHPHWGVTTTYYGAFSAQSSASYEPGYIQGAAAGTITLFADSIEADGQLYGQASAGPLQRVSGAIPSSGVLSINPGSIAASLNHALNVLTAATSVTPQWVLIQRDAATTQDATALVSQTSVAQSDANFTLADLNPTDRADTIILSSRMIDAGGFGGFSVSGSTLVAVDAALTVANGGMPSTGGAGTVFLGGGGSIAIAGPAIDIEGSLTAAAGSVTLVANGLGDPAAPRDTAAIIVGDDALIDVRGRWINDTGLVTGDLLGQNYINGGTITLQTKAREVLTTAGRVDTTGGIVVATPGDDDPDSPQLRVSSGGYVATNGKVKTVAGATGVPIGTGGSISLVTYVGGFTVSSGNNPAPDGTLTASVALNPGRSIDAVGFAGGGSLKISVGPSILVVDDPNGANGSPLQTRNGLLVVSSALLNGDGSGYQNPFATIDLESDFGSVTIAGSSSASPWVLTLDHAVRTAGSALTGIASYNDLGSHSVAVLPQYQRATTSLTLGPGQGDVQFYPGAVAETGSLVTATGAVSYDLLPGSTVVGSGVTVTTAPNRAGGGAIVLDSTYLTEVDGSVTAPAGTISLVATGLTNSGAAQAEVAGATVADGLVRLGSQSQISVTGAVVADPADTTLLTGGRSYTPTKLLAGGSVLLQATGTNGQSGTADSYGIVEQMPGSVIDVSGAVASIGVLTAGTGGQSVVQQTVYGDAGGITLNATAAILDGSFLAQGGGGVAGSTAANGIFSLTSGLPAEVLIDAGGSFAGGATAGSASLGDFLDTTSGNHLIVLAADNLSRARFDDINIGQVDSSGGLNDLSLITFSGDIRLVSRRSMLLAGPVSEAGAGDRVRIETGYLTLTTTNQTAAINPTSLDGSFTATARDILLERGIIAAGTVSLTATDDVAVQSVVGTRTQKYGAGGLIATGAVTISAQRLYPMGGSEGVIQALGGGGNGNSLTITSPAGATPTAPLSAGGVLYLLGSNIVQGGTVAAPGGSIIFGNGIGPQFFYFDWTGTSTPLVSPANRVTLQAGSVTSVSLDGLALPYGGTVDQVSWYYADPTRSQTALTAPPAKSISIDAGVISLAAGTATLAPSNVDIAGGGALYASEFVAGTGGSANVLAPDSTYTAAAFSPSILGNIALYNTVSTASDATGVTRTYGANRNSIAQVYAIVPLGENPSLAPSDLDFSTYASPSSNPGTGFGNPAPANGTSIVLSGVAGIADGTYTLLPAAYATLPGAYRVVIVPGSQNFQASQNTKLADGTLVVSAKVTTPLSPSLTATEIASLPIAVELQSRSVWGRYSNITTTDANSFFAAAGSARLPQDAGSLTLQAITALDLAGKLEGAATAGLGSIVAITARNLQILAADRGGDAATGYVTVDATQLSNLDAGSLLLGGIETVSSTADTIVPKSYSVEITSDAAHPLRAPEILIVTRGDQHAADISSSTGLAVDAGAVIEATGTASSSTAIRTITIGSADGKVIGDGAVLGVTSNLAIAINRLSLPSPTGGSSPLGTITIGADAVIRGNNDLVIDASDGASTSQIDATASLSARSIAISAAAISLGDNGNDGLIIPNAVVAELETASHLTLRAVGGGNGDNAANGSGAIEFAGVTSLALSAAGSLLTIDGTALSSYDGDSIALSATTIAFADSQGDGRFVPTSAPASLTVTAGTIDFAGGAQGIAFDQFDQMNLNATSRIDAQGTLAVSAADAAVTIATPLILADTGSKFSLTTTGAITLTGAGSLGTDTGSALGGSVAFIGGTVAVDTAVIAPSGNLSFEATGGDVTVTGNGGLAARGYAQSFFDVVKYAAAGTVRLTADHGDVILARGSTVALDAASQGGDAGGLVLNAVSGSVTLAGTISGQGPTGGSGNGGSFAVFQGSSIDLSTLAAQLQRGGFDHVISIAAGTGDLDLASGTITATTVSLIAQSGAVVLAPGTVIDVSGSKGGAITLFGNAGVDVEGSLLARGSSASQAGGTVTIGSAGQRDTGDPFNATYGYENIASAGTVTLGAASLIDVSGGTVAGKTGGSVKILVPLLESGGLPLAITSGASIRGADDTTIEAYAIWSTTDALSEANPALRFDGIVDPGAVQAATGAGAGDHAAFYQQTLMNFVEGFNVAAALPASVGAVHVQPGIDLVNDTATVNNGDITVASAWNLGAGGYDATGTVNLFYRTAAGEPGTLSLRAIGNVKINADITDGFFQTSNRLDADYQNVVGNIYLSLAPAGGSTQSAYITPLTAPAAPYDTSDPTYLANYASYLKIYERRTNTNQTKSGYARAWSLYQSLQSQVTYTHPQPDPTADTVSGFSLPQAKSPAQFASYSDYLNDYQSRYIPAYDAAITTYAAGISHVFQAPPAPAALAAPDAADRTPVAAEYSAYTTAYFGVYSAAYRNYLTTVSGLASSFAHSALNMAGTDELYQAPVAPVAPSAWGTDTGASTATYQAGNTALYGANGVSPNATANDPNPVMSADLVPADAVTAAAPGSGTRHALSQGSWSIQIVGGADAASVDPLGLQPLSAFQTDSATGRYTSGSVTLDGHTTYTLATAIQNAIKLSDPTLTQVSLKALVPTLIRTGTGTIDVAAATDVVLADTLAPAAIYTAGVQTSLPGADFISTNGGTALNGPNSAAAQLSTGGSNFFGDGSGTTIALDPAGFAAPNFGDSFLLTAPTLFAITTPAYPEQGGAITVTAQNDIIGVQSSAATATYDNNTQNGYLDQFWSNWLLTRSAAVAGATAYSFSADQGVYNPGISRAMSSDLTAGQTTWWINFGSFDQGVAALGGGDVTITAGHDIRQFSASTASTGRVSGGLDTNHAPVLHVTGGGDLTVTAGNGILSGSYYVALGTGRISAGGSIAADSANWSYKYTDSNAVSGAKVTVAPSVVLGVGDAQLFVAATGSVDIADIVNPTEIQSGVNIVVGDDAITRNGGASDLRLTNNTEFTLAAAPFNTMTADSSVNVAAIGGDVNFLTLPAGSANKLYQSNYRLLPASVDVTAYRGQVAVDSSFDMTNSDAGTLGFYAATNLRLVGRDNQQGTKPTATINGATSGEAGIATYQTKNSQTISTLFPIPGLIDTQFDPFNPAAASAGQTVSASYQLLHASGSAITHLYALQGDVTNGVVIADPTAVPDTTLPMPILTDMPIAVQAGQDVLNLQLYAQNTQSTDVTTVTAGRDITYNLPADNIAVIGTGTNGDNLIELAGPGALVLQAGRNLGPFPNDFNSGPSGVETTGAYDWTSGFINPKLPSTGASVFAYAGVAPGVGAAAEIANYLNPATAHFDSFLGVSYATEYAPQLLVYLRQLDPRYSDLTLDQAFGAFTALSKQQQQVFLDQVFFSQLQTTQSAPNILPELLGFEASQNLLGYSLAQIFDLFQNGSSPVGQAVLTNAYRVFATLSPTVRQQFVDEIATDTSTQAPNIWHTYALVEGLAAAGDTFSVGFAVTEKLSLSYPLTTPEQRLALIEQLTPDSRQAVVHTLGTEALVKTPNIWNVPGYARGYQMIDTLFSGAAGYTQNRLSGGLGAAGAVVATGKIDLRSATIQTQHGGDIQIFAPGGGVLLGSTAARAIYNQPGSTGLLTFQGGAISVFADQSLIVNQSRILTEEGGDVLTWSSNADILAGSGAKTSADFPPYTVLFDTDGLQSLNPAGLVTGAGIGALVTVNNQDPTQSNDYFMTPVGTVDAGDAGLRAAGNIVVAAAHVANAGNISVGGKSTGVPAAPAVNVGALASAGSAAASAAHAADAGRTGRSSRDNNAPSIISIDVLGFGGGDDSGDTDTEKKRKS